MIAVNDGAAVPSSAANSTSLTRMNSAAARTSACGHETAGQPAVRTKSRDAGSLPIEPKPSDVVCYDSRVHFDNALCD